MSDLVDFFIGPRFRTEIEATNIHLDIIKAFFDPISAIFKLGYTYFHTFICTHRRHQTSSARTLYKSLLRAGKKGRVLVHHQKYPQKLFPRDILEAIKKTRAFIDVSP